VCLMFSSGGFDAFITQLSGVLIPTKAFMHGEREAFNSYRGRNGDDSTFFCASISFATRSSNGLLVC
jgi:hypothetical protein